MLDLDHLFADLDSLGLQHWSARLPPILEEKLSDRAHGKLSEWRRILGDLPERPAEDVDLASATVSATCPADLCQQSRDSLLALAPWRKGPFQVGDIRIDSEWQSNLKWDRIRDRIKSLQGRAVLDVGCGNGYYALRMHGMGARVVVGVDPTVLFIMQHLAVRRFMPRLPVHLLPLRLHELPLPAAVFDTTFSMGVLYHQRNPTAHLEQLRSTLKPGGELVLETLVLPGDQMQTLTPPDRYARMRNVWLLPTIAQLEVWVTEAGFVDNQVIDVSTTKVEEQRTTEWMPFESLAEALDPNNSSLTVEGLPAPRRAVLLCHRN